MNRNRFCVLYCHAKGAWIVVRETVLGRGAVRYLGCVPMLLGWAGALQAQVEAAPAAAGANRPGIGAAEGVPLVQIAPPNPAGLSDNHYLEFNVDHRGLVLNNAREEAATQLAGAVAANPFLGGGCAAVILNQVVGTGPSHLAGLIEVAGGRADVIIANPNGIVCNGAGFLNTSRAVLTTGLPILGAGGGLEGFRVTGGALAIGEHGLDARTVDQVDLLARSLQVGGPVHVRGALNAVMGLNRVAWADLGVQALPAAEGVPEVAIDSNRLGGMYARRIHLVATEAGVGVNWSGALEAPDGLTLTADGRLRNHGTFSAGQVILRARGLDNQGGAIRQAGPGTASIDVRGNGRDGCGLLDNRRGTLAAAGERFDLRASVLANNDGGHILQEGRGRMSIRAGEFQNQQGGIVEADGSVEVSATGNVHNDGGRIDAGGTLKILGRALENDGGTVRSGDLALRLEGDLLNGPGGLVWADRSACIKSGHIANGGSLSAGTHMFVQAGQVLANKGWVRAGGRLEMSAKEIWNDGGRIEAPSTALASEMLRNVQGDLVAHDLGIRVRRLENSRGAILQLHDGPVRIEVAERITNTENGRIVVSAADLDLNTPHLDNAGGLLDHRGGGTLRIRTGLEEALRNDAGGTIRSQGKLDIHASSVHTRGGRIEAGGDVEITALRGDIQNASPGGGGLIQGGRVRLTAAEGTLDNQGAEVISRSDLAIHARNVANSRGTLQSGGELDLSVLEHLANGSGVIAAAGGARVEAPGFHNADSGILRAAGNLDLRSRELDNARGTLRGARVTLEASDLHNEGGMVHASEGLNLRVARIGNAQGRLVDAGEGHTVVEANTVDNSEGTLQTASTDLTIKLGSFINRGGVLIHSGKGALSLRIDEGLGVLRNEGGRISSQGTLDVSASNVDNRGGTFFGADSLRIAASAGDIDNRPDGAPDRLGFMGSDGAVQLTAERGGILNAGSTIEARGPISLRARAFDNLEGRVTTSGTGTFQILVEDRLGNDRGTLGGNGAVRLEAGTFENNHGSVKAQGSLDAVSRGDVLNRQGNLMSGEATRVNAAGTLDNTRGIMGAQGICTLRAARIDNASGSVRAGSRLEVQASGDLVNEGGRITGPERLDVSAARVDNRGGTLFGTHELRVAASAGDIDNRPDGAPDKPGFMGSDGAVQLTAERGGILNAGSAIEARGPVSLRAHAFDNLEGRATTSGTETFRAEVEGRLGNDRGTLGGNGAVQLEAGTLENNQGSVQAKGRLVAVSRGSFMNRRGILVSGEAVRADVAGVLANDGGTIRGGQSLEVQAGTLSNPDGHLVQEGEGGLKVTAAGALGNIRGIIGGRGASIVRAARIDNSSGSVSGGSRLEVWTSGELVNDQGLLGSCGDLEARAGTALTNPQGILSARGRLAAEAPTFDNSRGGRVEGEAGVEISAPIRLDNSRGEVRTAGPLSLSGGRTENVDGILRAQSDISLRASSFDNSRGQMGQSGAGEGNIAIIASGGVVNAGGRIDANTDLTVQAESMGLDGTVSAGRRTRFDLMGDHTIEEGRTIESSEDLTFATTGALVNFGRLRARGTVGLNAQALRNMGSGVIHGGATRIRAGTELSNLGTILGQEVQASAAGGIVTLPGSRIHGDTVRLRAEGDLVNRGEVTGRDLQMAAGSALVNEAGGAILGDKATVQSSLDLTNRGRIAGGEVALESTQGALATFGNVIATGTARLKAAGVLATAGTIASRGDLALSAGSIECRGDLGAGLDAEGRVAGHGHLSLLAHGALLASGHNVAGKHLFFRGASLDLTGARTHSGEDAELQATAGGITHRDAVLQARRRVHSASAGIFDNAGGRIGADILVLHGAALGNRGGTLVQAGRADMRIDVPGAIDNHGGKITTNAESLMIHASSIDCTGGGRVEHSGHGEFAIHTGPLEVRGGALATNGRLALGAVSMDLQEATLSGSSATLATTGDLRFLRTDLQAQGDLALQGAHVAMDSSRVVSREGSATVTASRSLDHAAGLLPDGGPGLLRAHRDTLIQAPGMRSTSTIQAGRHLEFRIGGEWLHSGNSHAGDQLTVRGASMVNEGGQVSAQRILMVGGQVSNAGGRLSAAALTAEVTTFSNTRGILELPGEDASGLVVGGALENRGGGRIAFGGREASLVAGRIDNAGGALDHGGSGTLILRGMDGHAPLGNLGGRIATNGTLDLDIAALDNRGGTISAQAAATITTQRGSIDNRAADGRAGSIRAGRLALQAQQGWILNQAGLLESEHGLAARAGGMRLDGGTVRNTLDGQVHLLASGEITNDGGTLSGREGVCLEASRIANSRGTVAAGRSLDVRGSGGIHNEGGILRSGGGLMAATEADLANAGGRLEAEAVPGTALAVSASRIDNTGGRIINGGAGLVELSSSSAFINANPGGLTDMGVTGGEGPVMLRSDTLHNVDGGRIRAGGDLDLAVGRLVENVRATIHAEGSARIRDRALSGPVRPSLGADPGVPLRNQGGRITAAVEVSIQASSLDNSGGFIANSREREGRVGLRIPSLIVNEGGTIAAGRDLSLDTRTLPREGTVASGEDLTFHLQGDFTHPAGASLAANRNLALTTTGVLSNHGRIVAPGNLRLKAGTFLNLAGGLLNGGTVRLEFPQTASNRGRIYGDAITIGSGTLVNGVGGLPFQPDLLPAPARPEAVPCQGWTSSLGPSGPARPASQPISAFGYTSQQPSGQGHAGAPGIIYGRHSVDIGVAFNITNEFGSLIRSDGRLAIGGAVEPDGRATGRSAILSNQGSEIRSGAAGMVLGADEIRNENSGFLTGTRVESMESGVKLIQPKGSATTYRTTELTPTTGPDGVEGCWRLPDGQRVTDYHEHTVTRTVTTTVVEATRPGEILSAGPIHIHGVRGVNNLSRIVAAGNIALPSGAIRNIGQNGSRVVMDAGTSLWAYTEWRGGWRSRRDRQLQDMGWYQNMSTATFPLADAVLSPFAPVPPASAWSGPTREGAAAPVSAGAIAFIAPGPLCLPGPSARFPVAPPAEPSPAPSPEAGRLQVVGTAELPIPGLELPRGPLYIVDTAPGAPIVVVVDPEALRGIQPVGMSYMIDRLTWNPEIPRQRLLDGFLEAEEAGRQIRILTGRFSLDPGLTDMGEQFRRLMDGGLAMAGSAGLEPGVMPSPAQLAGLSTDSVWPVQQRVTLPDGSVRGVLVPVVVLSPATAGFRPTSALISAREIMASLDGDLQNTGTILASDRVRILARGDIESSGGVHVTGSGGELSLAAGRDLTVSGVLQGSQMGLAAARDVTLASTALTAATATSRATLLDRVSRLDAERLGVDAGRNLTVSAARIDTSGDAALRAAGNVDFRAVTQSATLDLANGSHHLHVSGSADAGSRISVGGDLTVFAGGDLTATATELTARRVLRAEAAGDVAFRAGRATLELDAGGSTASMGFLSSSTHEWRHALRMGRSVRTLVAGETAIARSGANLTLSGSTFAGDVSAGLGARGVIRIEAVAERLEEASFERHTQSGLLSGSGVQVGIGRREETHAAQGAATRESQARSVAGAVRGDLEIRAGDAVHVAGSDLVAGAGMGVSGSGVVVEPGRDEVSHREVHETRQVGLTLGVSSSALAEAQSLAGHARAALASGGNPTALALHAMAAEGPGRSLAGRGANLPAGSSRDLAAAAGVRAEASLGASRSHSEAEERTVFHAGSTLRAGQRLEITSTRDDIQVRGSGLAGHDIALDSARDLLLASAVDTRSSHGNNRTEGGSLGVSAALGQQRSGLCMDLAANRARGTFESGSAEHVNAEVEARGTLTLRAVRDARLEGAQARGPEIQGTIGRDLVIASRQDAFTFSARQAQAGLTGSLPLAGSGGSARAGFGRDQADGDFRSVMTPSGLHAGQGGFQITVAGRTDLTGGLIASEAPAECNSLTTRTLTASDLANHSRGDARSSGFSLGTDDFGSLRQGLPAAGEILAGRGFAGTEDASITSSAIAPGTIRVTDADGQRALTGLTPEASVAALRRDTDDAHRALERPDMASLQREAGEERELRQMAAREVGSRVGQALDPPPPADTHLPLAPAAMPEPEEDLSEAGFGLGMSPAHPGDPEGVQPMVVEARAPAAEQDELPDRRADAAEGEPVVAFPAVSTSAAPRVAPPPAPGGIRTSGRRTAGRPRAGATTKPSMTDYLAGKRYDRRSGTYVPIRPEPGGPAAPASEADGGTAPAGQSDPVPPSKPKGPVGSVLEKAKNWWTGGGWNKDEDAERRRIVRTEEAWHPDVPIELRAPERYVDFNKFGEIVQVRDVRGINDNSEVWLLGPAAGQITKGLAKGARVVARGGSRFDPTVGTKPPVSVKAPEPSAEITFGKPPATAGPRLPGTGISAGSEASKEVERLVAAAGKPYNETGLSVAARKIAQHAGRPGGTFKPPTGSIAEQNEAASQFIRTVLADPKAVRTQLSKGGFEYRLPNGKGVRFNPDGTFNTVLDPKLPKQ